MKPKRILSIMLCIALLSALLPISTAFASDPYISIDGLTLYDADGDGYYEIGTADELYAFAKAVNTGSYAINAKLTKNITVNETVPSSHEEAVNSDDENYRLWTPIGNNDESGSDISYVGTFDGNGKTISGLYCTDSVSSNIGLFGSIGRMGAGESMQVGTVKNLTVKDSYFGITSQNAHIGAVVGYLLNGAVTGCRNENSTIYCNSDSGYAGGVIGYGYASNNAVLTIQNCSNSGNVSVSSATSSYGYAYVGGVIGYFHTYDGTITIQSCSNSGKVSASSATSSSGYAYAGGVIGYGSAYCGAITIQNCSSSGNVSATSATPSYGCAYAGGVSGYTSTSDAILTIQSCSNSGNISAATSSYGYAYTGGVSAGNSAYNGTVTITSCYNAGSFGDGEDASDNGSYYSTVGGIVASVSENGTVTIAKCYYLGEEETDEFDGTTALEEADFHSGKAAYLLNHGSDDSVAGGIEEDTFESIWKQTIGLDKYPNFIGLEVLSKGDDCYFNDLSRFKIHRLGDDKKSAVIVLNQQGTYTVIFADYEDNGLANAKTFEVTVDSEKAVQVVSDEDFTLDTGDKIILCDDLNNLTPLCDAYEVN